MSANLFINGRRLNSVIRSVQRGTILLNAVASNTATINAVDVDNSILIYDGILASTATDTAAFQIRLALTNSTTITATASTAASPQTNVSYEIIEYWPGLIRSVQRGTITITTALSNTATINAVNLNKCTLYHLGNTYSINNTMAGAYHRLILTNTTTVTATHGDAAAATSIVSYQVVEWF